MNKEKFLKDLEKRLAVLSEEEKNDILNEQRDIIEEKIKHGKTEEEAVRELGSVEALAKEILNAYKINPDYNRSETKEKTKQIMDDCEDLIKKGAKKLSDVTEEVVGSFKSSGKEFNLENVLEIIIKVFLVLLLLSALRIPFSILGSIGGDFFDFSFPFFGNFAFRALWHIVLAVIYIAACIFIVLAFANEYTKKNNVKTEVKKKEKGPVPSHSKEIKKESSNSTTNEIQTEPVQRIRQKEPRKDSASEVLLLFIKIFTVLVVLFPLWCAIFGLMIAIAVIIWMIVKGIMIVGPLVLVIGVTAMFLWFADFIYNALFKNRLSHLWTIAIPFIMILVGGIMSIDYFAGFTYYDTLPSDFKLEKVEYKETIRENTFIYADNKTYVIDSTLEDNQAKIVVEYYNDYMNVRKDSYNSGNHKTISIELNGKARHFFGNDTNLFFEQLKQKRWYPYNELAEMNVTIYTNQKTRDFIQ